MPAGMTAEDLGKCSHVLRVKGNSSAYEIGVVRRRDGRPGFSLVFDFWGSNGRALEQKAGSKCGALLQEYSAAVVTKNARGYSVTRERAADGTLRLTLQR